MGVCFGACLVDGAAARAGCFPFTLLLLAQGRWVHLSGPGKTSSPVQTLQLAAQVPNCLRCCATACNLSAGLQIFVASLDLLFHYWFRNIIQISLFI